MGCVLGVVLTDGGGFDHQTGGIELQQRGQLLVGNHDNSMYNRWWS